MELTELELAMLIIGFVVLGFLLGYSLCNAIARIKAPKSYQPKTDDTLPYPPTWQADHTQKGRNLKGWPYYGNDKTRN